MDHSNPSHYNISEDEARMMRLDFIAGKIEDLASKVPLTKAQKIARAQAKIAFYHDWIISARKNGWGYGHLNELQKEKERWEKRLKWYRKRKTDARESYDLEEIKSIPMKEVLSLYGVRPEKNGFYKCFMHGEKTPSAKEFKNRFKCFGCGAYLSTIDVVMHFEKSTIGEAIKKLANLR